MQKVRKLALGYGKEKKEKGKKSTKKLSSILPDVLMKRLFEVTCP